MQIYETVLTIARCYLLGLLLSVSHSLRSGLLFLCLLSAAAHAQFSGISQGGNGDSASVAPVCTQDVRMTRRGPTPARVGEPVYVNAEQIDLERFGQSEFVGSVLLERADQQVETGRLLYDRSIGEVLLPEALSYSDQDYEVRAQNASYIVRDGTASFNEVEFEVVGSTANGNAQTVLLESDGIARLTSLDFTTCPGDEPAWELSAARVKLDREAGVGTARNATLRFQGIPLLYLPWISFPIDDRRKSGFLYPTFSTTSDNGVAFGWPYYWNIAPNMDATIVPRFISGRGPAVGAEYRFLTRRASGEVDGDYLPSDDEFAGRDRYRYRTRARYRFGRGIVSRLNVHRVSDEDYFLNFGGDINETTISFLRSDFGFYASGRGWNAALVFDDFQELDTTIPDTSEPYSRLPRLTADWRQPLYGNLDFVLDAEAVYFERDVGPVGARLDVNPAIEWRYQRPGWYIAPRAGFRYTAYSLSNLDESVVPLVDDSPSRTVPIFSVDSGLIFEKGLQSGDRITLEPRLFYAYVPFEQQDDLPDFDTAELTFGISQLFNTNRFTGADRQSEANQLSWAVTSRLIDGNSGRQYLDVTLGQTLFFRDQNVQLPNAPATDFVSSAILAEVNYRPFSNWAVTAGIQYDPEDSKVDVGLLGVSYIGDSGLRIQGGYRFRDQQVDQVDFRVRYPISDSWNLLGRWNYSFLEDTTLESVLGFEYESCCWALQLIGRQFVNARDGSDQIGVFVELHLKGLGSLGRQPYDLFGINQRNF